MKKILSAMTALFIAAFLAQGCSNVPDGTPPAPESGADKMLYKNEGVHFEKPFEYWFVTGALDTDAGKMYFTSSFYKVGNIYLHSRNGYNSLRMEDGSYDYRSYGGSIVSTLVENHLKSKIERYPEDERYKKTLEKLRANESEHFLFIPEKDRPMYRNRLFLHLGENQFERTSQDSFSYILNADTWAGLLNLELEALAEPVTYYQENKINVGSSFIIGFVSPRLEVKGTLKNDGKEIAVSGVACYDHFWGTPDPRSFVRQEHVTQRLNNGGSFYLSNYYDKNGKLTNTKFVYQKPDGTVARDMIVETTTTGKWKSDVSRVTYPISWNLSGDDFQGAIDATFADSEIMIEEGIGAFWLGPCTFKGRLGGKLFAPAVTGEGFCRVVGTEDKPYDPFDNKFK